MLAALTPGLLLTGHGALAVPVGIVLLWGLLYAWTGVAWPRNDLNWPIAALLVLSAGSLLVSRDLLWPLPKIATLFLGVAWFFAIVRCAGAGLSAQSLTRLLVAACLGLTLAAAVGTKWPEDGVDRSKFPALSAVSGRIQGASAGLAGDGVLHPNALAGTLLLLIPLCVAPLSRGWHGPRAGSSVRYVPQRNPDVHSMLRLGAVGSVLFLSLAALVLTQSRGGWTAAAASGLCLWLYNLRACRVRPEVPIVLSFLVGAALVIFGATAAGVSWLGGFYGVTDLENKMSFRAEMWWLGLAFIRDFPWTGVGFNGFRNLAVPLYDSPTGLAGIETVHPHNMWLGVGVDFGIPGIVAYAALWALAIRGALRVVRDGSPTDAIIGRSLLATWTAFWVFGIADAIPLGTKLGTVLWPSFALGQILCMQHGKAGCEQKAARAHSDGQPARERSERPNESHVARITRQPGVP